MPSLSRAIWRSVAPSKRDRTTAPSASVTSRRAPVAGSVMAISLPVSLPKPMATMRMPAATASPAASKG